MGRDHRNAARKRFCYHDTEVFDVCRQHEQVRGGKRVSLVLVEHRAGEPDQVRDAQLQGEPFDCGPMAVDIGPCDHEAPVTAAGRGGAQAPRAASEALDRVHSREEAA